MQKPLTKQSFSHKPHSSKQAQVSKPSKLHQPYGIPSKAIQRWIPKALLQAQGYYQGKTSIWVPKQKQGQAEQPKTQAQISITKESINPIQRSAFAKTNLEINATNNLSKPTFQHMALSIGRFTRQANLFLQLMQGKVSQVVVAKIFMDLSQTPPKQDIEKTSTMISKVKDPILFFSKQDASHQEIARLSC